MTQFFRMRCRGFHIQKHEDPEFYLWFMIFSREEIIRYRLAHIITDFLVKQANEDGKRVVANNTPKHKIGKE